MKLRSIALAIALFAGISAYAQDEKKTLDNVANVNANQAEFKFEEEEYSFGNITQGESVTHEYKFTNIGNEPLIITNAQGSCGCTVPLYSKEPIMKGQSGTIKVTFNSTGKLGIQDKTVTITSNAKQNPMVLHIKGTVEKPVSQPAVDQVAPKK
jgi:hypothetical protein